eukprot:9499409-Pyramimonas_sp.AAC.1
MPPGAPKNPQFDSKRFPTDHPAFPKRFTKRTPRSNTHCFAAGFRGQNDPRGALNGPRAY